MRLINNYVLNNGWTLFDYQTENINTWKDCLAYAKVVFKQTNNVEVISAANPTAPITIKTLTDFNCIPEAGAISIRGENTVYNGIAFEFIFINCSNLVKLYVPTHSLEKIGLCEKAQMHHFDKHMNDIQTRAEVLKDYLAKLNEDSVYAPAWQEIGWLTITAAFRAIYPETLEENFVTTMESRAVSGGAEFLDGFSVYTSHKGYKHIVSFGMTELYGNENALFEEWSGWGYEMTIKLKEASTEDCLWAMHMMSNLARYTYTSKRFFEENQYVQGDGTPIKIGSDSKITALAIVHDTEVKTQVSVHGKIEFLQLVGLTTREVAAVRENLDNLFLIISKMKEDGNVDLVTDMNRTKEYV